MFNSRDKRFRNPTGAVKQGQSIHFKITLPRSLAATGALLIMLRTGKEPLLSNLFWCGMNGEDQEFWECDFIPEDAGLYFYHFEITTQRGRMRFSRGMGGEAVPGGMESWQLTVYEKEFQTPGWLTGGVFYQIFPDRFHSSKAPKGDLPYGRTYHESWEEGPDWKPNEKGEITNSDFFGGDLKGIEEKLPYLASLGVTCLYLNPIFESHSNHRYDTADYSKIDPLLGDEEDFKSLCTAAKKQGISVILDGVFSHTGSDSLYFNREGRYGENNGAYRSQESPYYPWYSFRSWPNEYDCWWNFITLPNVTEVQRDYNEYMNGENGIVRKWLRAGAAGWRLDVADELPDEFIDNLRAAVKAENPQALLLGEVWEDASNKSAYGFTRRYLLGQQLDTVMNYPFREAILGFLLGKAPEQFCEEICSILENYPPQCTRLLMNHIGTHDTERAITILAGEPCGNRDRSWQSQQRLSPEGWATGISRLKLAALLQFTLPGVPCIYYGDEAGVEGYRDPFNRRTYPWGKENGELLAWYRALGALRKEHSDILGEGEFHPIYAKGNLVVYRRTMEIGEKLCSLKVILNRSSRPQSLMESGLDLTGGALVFGHDLSSSNILLPFGCSVIREEASLPQEKKSDSSEKHLDN